MRQWLFVADLVEMLALVIWVGGMLALGAIAAPAIFQSSPSRASAGRTFGLILRRFERVAYACGAALLLAGAFRFFSLTRYPANAAVRWAGAALMLALALGAGLVVSRRLDRLRERMPGGIDQVKLDDPRRVEFNRLHRLSTTILAFNLLLGFALVILFALRD
jgi:uncharacterized membrane protein